MKLQLSPRAREDVAEIGRYIRIRNPAAALAVRAALRDSMNMLVTYPKAGREVRAGLFRLVVPRLPYVIFYQIEETAGQVRIITVRHAARHPEE